jgi:2'-hydroxyisoflavone reductase
MDVLVVGGTRYMGRMLVQALLERGDGVTVFSRGNTRPDWWDDVAHVTGDRHDADGFIEKLRGRRFDAVIDTQAYKKEDVESASEAFKGSVGRYVMVSTGSVYLDGKLDTANHCPFEESDVSWDSLDYTYPKGEDPYGVGKRHCEKWLRENGEVPYTIVRIPAVMGWDDPTGRMWWWVQRALDGGAVVIPSERRAVFRTLYSGDAANAFIRVIDSDAAENEVYHIAMQEIMTLERWTSLLWAAAGHESEIAYVSDEVIQRQERLEDHIPPLARPVPSIYNLSRAERDFGFSTTPVEEWVPTTVAWYHDQYQGDESQGYSHRTNELSLAARWRDSFSTLKSRF